MARWIINARSLRHQTALWLVVAVIALSPLRAGAARPSVLVPESNEPERCFAVESIAAMIAMTPGVRLIRAPIDKTESLDSARQRLRADLAISGERRATGAEKFKASIELIASNKPPATGSAESNEPSIAALLTPLWPKDLPPLSAGDAFAAANPRALDAACKGDSGTAYAVSGAAVGEALKRLVDPIDDPKVKTLRPLLLDWARGEAFARKKRWPEAAIVLRRTLDRLRANESAPLWRRSFDTAATSPDVKGAVAIVLDNGRFIARTLESGRVVWSIEVGVAEPHLFDAGRGLLLAVGNGGVTAIDAAGGAIRWRVELTSPWAEIAERGDAVLIANAEEVRAVHRLDGRELWRFESVAAIAAGPVIAGGRVVLPLEAELLLLDSDRGVRVNHASLGDELSSPLFSTDRAVWSALGAVQLAYTDLTAIGDREPPIKKLTLPGVIWPPLSLGTDLLIATKDRKRGTAVMRVPADASSDPKVWFRGGVGPLLPLPALDTVALFSDKRDTILVIGRDGRVRWRDKAPLRVAAGAGVHGGALWTAAADRVRALDPASGKPLISFSLGEPIREIAFGEAGSLTLVDGGAYGLPGRDDPRHRAWLRAIRLRLAETYIALNRAPAAEEMVRAVLDRDPGDVEALALQARATRDPKKSIAAWLGIASQVPPGDPLETQALEALEKSVGLVARLAIEQPITTVVTSSDGVAAYQSGERVFALASDLRSAPRWSKVGSLLVPHGLWLKIDDEWVRASDGSTLGKEPRSPVLTRAGALRADATEVSLEAPPGTIRWRAAIAGARILDGSDRAIAVETSGPLVRFLDATSGSTLSVTKVKTPVRGAVVSGDRALISLDRELDGVDVGSGKILFRAPAIPALKRRILPVSNGWMVIQGSQVVVIDRAGRSRSRIALTSAPIQVAVDGARMFATLERGGLVSLDLTSGKVRGRIDGVEIGAIAAGNGKVFAATKGALLVFAADRMFAPSGRPPP